MEYKGRYESPSYIASFPTWSLTWQTSVKLNYTRVLYIFFFCHSPIGQLVHLSLLSTNFLDFDSCQISCYLYYSWTWWTRSWNSTFFSDVIVKQQKSTRCWSLLLFAFLFIHETLTKVYPFVTLVLYLSYWAAYQSAGLSARLGLNVRVWYQETSNAQTVAHMCTHTLSMAL